ncbi:hypothetical protein LRP88_00428 [Fusarium phalaenopsidis]|nr:hypothetical protein NCS56_01338200 [Fusarium sp. Ph1]
MAALGVVLYSALDSAPLITAEVSFLLGIVTHLVIRPFEIDSQAWAMVFAYLGVITTLLLTYIQVCKFTILGAILRTALVSNAFNVGLASSILIYRAFFHRLHRFPGPFPAKLSRFYAMKNAAKALKANEEVQKLHEIYGDFVRVGPREISITRESAISIIYEPPNQCVRSTWYSQVSDDVRKISLHTTRDLTAHKLRKKAWVRGLGFRALAIYEEKIAPKVDILMARIAEKQGTPMDMTLYAAFFGFDVMGQVGFSKDFNMLDSGHKHPAIQALHENMAAVGVLSTVPWLMSMLGKIPGATGSYARFADWCARELQAKRAIDNKNKEVLKDHDPRDVISWLLRAEDENDRSAPPGEGAFQEDSRLMIVAGSDTTAVALTNTLFFLTKYPMCYRKLQAAVQAQFPEGVKDWTYEKAKSIPYLEHVIHETLRLKPSAPGGLSRLTPPQGLQIDEVFIPDDTIVSVPTYTIQRDERYWENALEFRPERWENVNPEKVAWIPFSRGQYSCPGKNLAFMELRMVLSRIALEYNLAFPPGDDGEAFDKGARDTFTLNVPELPIIFTTIN